MCSKENLWWKDIYVFPCNINTPNFSFDFFSKGNNYYIYIIYLKQYWMVEDWTLIMNKNSRVPDFGPLIF